MTEDSKPFNIFACRLKELRLERGISQRMLGIAAGLDAGVASTRMNRYETGTHSPDYLTASRIAAALEVPLPALYGASDELVELIRLFEEATPSTKGLVLQTLQAERLVKSEATAFLGQ